MILEMGSIGGSDSLKRPAMYGSSFPLKKRRIKYELEELSMEFSKSPNDSTHVKLEPENLAEPQDLRVRPRQHPPVPPQGPTSAPPTMSNYRLHGFHGNDFPLPNKDSAPPTRPLEQLSLNPPAWPHQSAFINLTGRSHHFFAPPNHPYHKMEYVLPHHQPPVTHAPLIRNLPNFHQPQIKAECRKSPTSNFHISKTIFKMEMEEDFAAQPPRESVIIHGATGFGNEHRDTVSRSSCDSGVSSRSGSSAHSTTSLSDAGSCLVATPTVLNGSVRYQCPTCPKAYSTVSGLSKHVQFHCGAGLKKSFVCKDCDKVYNSLGALKMHIRTHTLPCKCQTCGKAFSRPWLLEGHKRTHTGEKPYACHHCSRAFADRSNLRAHLQTHSEVKKYSCHHCAKTFSRMSLLTKHEESGCSTPSK